MDPLEVYMLDYKSEWRGDGRGVLGGVVTSTKMAGCETARRIVQDLENMTKRGDVGRVMAHLVITRRRKEGSRG